MIQRTFNPNKPYRAALYLRMSSDKQNPKSPQQQQETIEAIVKRLKLPWETVKVYTDAAISGRLSKKRNDYQRMLRDIRTKAITVDLILVDTMERFGRSDEADAMRKQLIRDSGVLVLTADTSFADPTTPSGELYSTMQSYRTRDDNRVKAHNVLRGKRMVVQEKHWPGGVPPFGYKLQKTLKPDGEFMVLDYSVLVPDPESDWILRELYQRAFDTKQGCVRLATWFNSNPQIPDKFKPVSFTTVGRWMTNSIYKGLMIWELRATDVINDRRVCEHNPEDVHIRIEDYCKPIVEPRIWDGVKGDIDKRKKLPKAAPGAAGAVDQKLIAPLQSGIAITYILSGLVVCGNCGLSMSAASSSIYKLKTTGELKRYVNYRCLRTVAGGCDNHTSVPEEWLRDKVIELLRTRLFGE
ncbi:hypothetical protein BH11PLA2_BH11PLA2_50250 [soil metagenome]